MSLPPVRDDWSDAIAIAEMWVAQGRWLRPGLDRARNECLVSQWMQTLRSALGVRCITCRGETRAGLVVIEPSPWDSEMIGSRTGRAHFFVVGQTDSASRPGGDECTREVLSVGEMLSTEAGQAAREDGMRLLVSRVSCEDALVAQALENTGFRLMDTLVTFLRRDVHGETHRQQQVRGHVTGDEPALVGIAEESFRDGHFYSDVRVSLESCRTVYGEWTKNSCRGRADAVLVVDSEDGPTGFITCLIDPELRNIGIRRGIIELVAVDPCRQHVGVGRRLVSGALQWFAASGVTEVEVGTQVTNVAAGSLYLKQGFRPAWYRHTFHRWSD